jgi:hypothetical protein
MTRRPRPPTMTEKLAAAFLEIQRLKGDPIPRQHAKAMSAEQICRLTDCDHDPVRVETAMALGWTVTAINHPTNLDFKFRPAHRVKTATRDMPEIAKGRRITAAQAKYRANLLAKANGEPAPRHKRKSRPMPGGKDSGWKQTMSGKWVRRKPGNRAEGRA